MNYLLLDHDGVMITSQWYGWRFRHPNRYNFDKFDPKCVKVLNEVIKSTNCEIVVTSDWKLYQPLSIMREFYTDMGVIKEPISYTEDKHFGDVVQNRISEIEAWVRNNLGKKDKWVAVDDMNMVDELEPNFVHTPISMEGIKQCGVKDKIIKKFIK